MKKNIIIIKEVEIGIGWLRNTESWNLKFLNIGSNKGNLV